MKKFVCIICGYVHEGDCPPEKCPICGAGAEKFKEQTGELSWAAEHEVGMYLAMSRVADREGYPEVAEAYKRIAFEEAEHAAKFAEMLGEVVTASTKKNLELRVAAENGATAGKVELAKLAKQQNLDAIHDTVHEMARDEARHGKAFAGLLNRYFG